MKRIAFLLSVCLFLFASAALAEEGVTLSDDKAGYTITLPEFWIKMEPAALVRSGSLIGGNLSQQARAQLQSTLQGAIFHAANYSSVMTLVIHYASNESMGLTPEHLATITAPGNPITEKIRRDLEKVVKEADLTVQPSPNPPDGIAIAMQMNTANGSIYFGPKLYGITHVRFTKDNVIFISAHLMVRDAPERKGEVQGLLDSLVISPDKLLFPAAGKAAPAVDKTAEPDAENAAEPAKN